jgi:F0F1-type ATP synthase delta subunit
MHVKTDPMLIGGFMLDIEHDRMDASIKGRLEKLKTENG